MGLTEVLHYQTLGPERLVSVTPLVPASTRVLSSSSLCGIKKGMERRMKEETFLTTGRKWKKWLGFFCPRFPCLTLPAKPVSVCLPTVWCQGPPRGTAVALP